MKNLSLIFFTTTVILLTLLVIVVCSHWNTTRELDSSRTESSLAWDYIDVLENTIRDNLGEDIYRSTIEETAEFRSYYAFMWHQGCDVIPSNDTDED